MATIGRPVRSSRVSKVISITTGTPTMRVDAYHSGVDGHPRGSFLLMPVGSKTLPPHPDGKSRHWAFWKEVRVNALTKNIAQVKADLETLGFHVQ